MRNTKYLHSRSEANAKRRRSDPYLQRDVLS